MFTKTSAARTNVTSKRTYSNTGKTTKINTKAGSKNEMKSQRGMKSEKTQKRKIDTTSSKGGQRNMGSTQNTITSNNRRYQADKAKSQVGLLVGMSIRRTSKTQGSYNEKQMKENIQHDQDDTNELNIASPQRSADRKLEDS